MNKRSLVPLTNIRNTVPFDKWSDGGSGAVVDIDSGSGSSAPRKRADARRNEETLLDAAAAAFITSGVDVPVRERAKLREVNVEVEQGRHQPIPEQGRWLRSVVQGHLAYYAVPGNTDAVAAFRTQVSRYWFKALRRRSQRTRLNWQRTDRLTTKWLSPARVNHPFPEERFDARTRRRSPVR